MRNIPSTFRLPSLLVTSLPTPLYRSFNTATKISTLLKFQSVFYLISEPCIHTSIVISLTRRWKGSLLINNSVLFWYLRISWRATTPGFRFLCRFFIAGFGVARCLFAARDFAENDFVWSARLPDKLFREARGIAPLCVLRAVCLFRVISEI